MQAAVTSNKNKKKYTIMRMSEYDIETSLDIPADHFNIIIENPVDNKGYGINAELFNDNDNIVISDDGVVILDGISDVVNENWDESSSKVEIDGRDRSLLLLENDAEPKTYNKIKFSQLLKRIAAPYGFTSFKVNQQYDKVINKIVVDVGVSEWDVLLQEAKKLGMWLWCTPNVALIGDVLNYKNPASYKFSNDLTIKDAIRIKKFSKKKTGADVKGEVWVRGHGKKAFTTKYTDKTFLAQGYKRRMITEDGEIKNISQGQSTAKRLVQEKKRGHYEIEITIHGKNKIETNKTAYIKDKRTKTEGVFFVVGVRDKKNNNVGHEKIIRLRPLGEGL